MNILITGSSGLIGSALCHDLPGHGHRVYRLLRDGVHAAPFHWQPEKSLIRLDDSVELDAVIHLAGANISDGRWNQGRKTRILESRVQGTRLLSSALAKLARKPEVLISASAIGYYGDTGERTVDEAGKPGSGFLTEICQAWEQATQEATAAGIRTVHIRTGIVLSGAGGALKKMLLPYQFGLGGVIGSGKQYMSWVSLREILHMIRFIIANKSITGPVNLVSRTPVTNQTFTRTLGAVLNRPTILPAPAFIVKLLFGEMGETLLLAGSGVAPGRLIAAGYDFIDDDLEVALRHALGR